MRADITTAPKSNQSFDLKEANK